jgi:hypothetical protein
MFLHFHVYSSFSLEWSMHHIRVMASTLSSCNVCARSALLTKCFVTMACMNVRREDTRRMVASPSRPTVKNKLRRGPTATARALATTSVALHRNCKCTEVHSRPSNIQMPICSLPRLLAASLQWKGTSGALVDVDAHNGSCCAAKRSGPQVVV